MIDHGCRSGSIGLPNIVDSQHHLMIGVIDAVCDWIYHHDRSLLAL